ncbi:MAG: carboxylate--amine ligase [Azospirillum brasilense]|nr:MAG: carboxylate--amine ligase [Azospirillum brasilense]
MITLLDKARHGWRSMTRTATAPHEIEFQPSKNELTLGVEVELQLMDAQTMNLAPRAEEMLAALADNPKVKPEFYLSTIEANTGICADVGEVERDLKPTLDAMAQVAAERGIALATTGCHPFARYSDCIIADTARYQELIDRNQWLTRRMTVYGLHVHVGMKSGDDCIRYNNFFMHVLPHLLALSASSPFWQGDDTGLSSCRPTTYEALPTAGMPYEGVHSWADFEKLYHTLKACGSIQSLKDLWWDLRPSPGFGTLEIRVCDGLPSLAGTLAITAFIHGLAHWFRDHGEWMAQVPRPASWVMRENKWRVIRHGLEAELVTNNQGATKPIRQDIEEWLTKIAPYTDALGYSGYIATLRDIMAQGTSSERQRAVFARTQSLQEVARHNAHEFAKGHPVWVKSNAA